MNLPAWVNVLTPGSAVQRQHRMAWLVGVGDGYFSVYCEKEGVFDRWPEHECELPLSPPPKALDVFHLGLEACRTPGNLHASLVALLFVLAGRHNQSVASPVLAFALDCLLLVIEALPPEPVQEGEPVTLPEPFRLDYVRPEVAVFLDNWGALGSQQRAEIRDQIPWLHQMADVATRGQAEGETVSPHVTLPCLKDGVESVLRLAQAALSTGPSLGGFAALPLNAETHPVPGDVVELMGHEFVFVESKSQCGPAFLYADVRGMRFCASLPLARRRADQRVIDPDRWSGLLMDLAAGTPKIAVPLMAHARPPKDPIAAAYRAVAVLRSTPSKQQAARAVKMARAALKDVAPDKRLSVAASFPELRAIANRQDPRPSNDFAAPLRMAKDRELLSRSPQTEQAPLPIETGRAPVAHARPERIATSQAPAPGPAARLNSPARPRRAKPAPSGKHHRLLEAEWTLDRDKLDAITQQTFRWIEEKIGMSLAEGWNSGSHEFEYKAKRVETERHQGLLAFRLEHPGDGADSTSLGRRWRVEGTLVAPVDESAPCVAAIRVTAIDNAPSLPLPAFSIPNLAKQWLGTGGLKLLDRPADTTWVIGSAIDLFGLCRLIEDENRDAGLIITQGPPVALPPRLRGVALHAHIAPDQVASYRKKVGPLSDGEAHIVPMRAAAPTVMAITEAAQVEQAIRSAAFRGDFRLPSFADVRSHVRRAQVDHARRQGNREAQGLSVQPEDFQLEAQMQSTSEEAAELLDIALADLDASNDVVRRLKLELKESQQQIRALKLALGAAPEQAPEPEQEPLPDTFARLEQWAKNLRPRLVMSAKAVRHAKDCESFYDKPLVYACLEALATHYWEMRWGEREGGRKGWLQFLEDNHLDFGPVGEAIENHRFADAYKVKVDGRTYPLDLHVQGSSARDPNRCLRVYLHADDDRRRVLIGHLPSHLPNTLT